jgi:hypothetical protein
MTDKQQSQHAAQTENDKAIFVFAVVWVVDQLGAFVDEYGSCFFKRDAVLLGVRIRLAFVLFEAKCAHCEF